MSARTAVARLSCVLAMASLLGFVCATGASALPQLGIDLTRTEAPLNRGDERLVYEVTVVNEGGINPKVGDELTCTGASDGSGASPPVTFVYQWLRDSTVIPGEGGETYAVVADDEGALIQCRLTATNDPDGPGGTYAPISSTVTSLPPVLVEPSPPSAPPSGSARPAISGPLKAASPEGTATVTTGSQVLTDAVAAEGTGTLTLGSHSVTGATASTGAFQANQVISGSGIPEKTIIESLKETAPGVFELTLSQAATLSGSEAIAAGAQPFGIGQEISGECIPPGTKIIAATNQGGSPEVQFIEIDQEATCSKAGVLISATATLTCSPPAGWSAGGVIDWSFRWLRNGQPIPGATSAAYTVQSTDTTPPSVLQCEALAEDSNGKKAMAISFGVATEPIPYPPSPYQFPAAGSSAIDFDNQTTGLVTLDMVMPDGHETSVYKAISQGNSWTCTKEAPKLSSNPTVHCEREDPLSPQDSYEPIEVVTSVGKNPPDLLVTEAEVQGGNSEPDSAADEYTIPNPAIPFGFKAFETLVLDELGDDYTKAGGHPFTAGASLAFNTHVRAEEAGQVGLEGVNGSTRAVKTDPPPGFIGNPEAVPAFCSSIADVLAIPTTCPEASVVGLISTRTSAAEFESYPIYALEPEFGVAAQFAFRVTKYVYTLAPEIRPEDGYAISLITAPLAKSPEIFSAEVTLCGSGAIVDSSDPANPVVERCLAPGELGATEIPFLTNPTRCSGGAPVTTISADSWEAPGTFASKSFTSPPLTECDAVQFQPQSSLAPTSRRADSPTGMDVEIKMPTEGLEDPFGTAEANLKSAKVTLPEGMAVNPAAANGLGACSLGEIGISAAGVPNSEPVSCPESSKIGTVEAQTPLLEETLAGTLYIARQSENPFGSLLALYMVIDSPRNGILVKLAGEVSPDPASGQLTVSFDDNPQVPIESVKVHFPGGENAPLITPPLCGAHGQSSLEAIRSEFTPWNAADPENPTPAETVTSTSTFTINEGPGGGPCPSGALEPSLSAGMLDAQAGSTSPFTLRLSRPDGSRRFRSLQVTMPPGLTAYLKGVPSCPDSALASVPTDLGSAAAQLTAPACPAASQIGSVIAGAGAGAHPFFLDTGRAYLAGPYKGAPLSLAIITPALAGPFDLGNVLVRTALYVNPTNAQITAVSDPIPTILHGLLLDLRELRVNVDRPNFTVAPTNCEPLAVSALVGGEGGESATATEPFQVGGCDKLGFKPRLKLRLKGETRRTGHPGLIATVKGRPGDANIAYAQVTLPPSAFVENAHIRTICTRVQFAADQCPSGSIYGRATATTPLLEAPLSGNVYLRSSDNPLPDLVVALKGPESLPVEVELSGRTDSAKGALRNTFAAVPDAPVSSFRLQLFGGRKGLIVNSKNLCRSKQRATVRLRAHNGRVRELRPVVGNGCGPKKKGHRGGKNRRR